MDVPNGQVGTLHIPSQAQREEALRVQGMQVRTNAANMATQMLSGRGSSQHTWASWAVLLEGYIRDGFDADHPAPPVRTRA